MSETLTPGRMAERLQGRINLDAKTSGMLSTELFSIISRELKKEESVSLFGFGTFKRIPVPISKGRNPHTGEDIIIPAHFRIKFSPAARVAERINAEYAHLKPVILQEEKKHEGLLLKAERYVLSVKADPEPPHATAVHEEGLTSFEEKETASIPTAVSAENVIVEEEKQPASKHSGFTEPDFGFEKDRKTGTQKKGLMLLGGLVLLLGMGWIVLDRNSEDEVTGISVSREAVETIAKPAAPTLAVSSEAPVQNSAPAVPTAEAPPVETTEYRIVTGDSFSLLARDKWGSIHLWPYLYEYNKELFPDPDLIRPGDIIAFPPKPDLEKDQRMIEKSVMGAYQRYRNIITANQNSPRNLNREVSIGYVLLGGDILYPGFIDRYRASIRTKDISRAEDLNR